MEPTRIQVAVLYRRCGSIAFPGLLVVLEVRAAFLPESDELAVERGVVCSAVETAERAGR
jgi:hypothetical protein